MENEINSPMTIITVAVQLILSVYFWELYEEAFQFSILTCHLSQHFSVLERQIGMLQLVKREKRGDG